MKRLALVPLFGLVGLVACFPLNGGLFGRGTQPGSWVGYKQVMEKRAPAYLIATDKSECTVSSDKYEDVLPGDRVLCTWKSTGVGEHQPM